MKRFKLICTNKDLNVALEESAAKRGLDFGRITEAVWLACSASPDRRTTLDGNEFAQVPIENPSGNNKT